MLLADSPFSSVEFQSNLDSRSSYVIHTKATDLLTTLFCYLPMTWQLTNLIPSTFERDIKLFFNRFIYLTFLIPVVGETLLPGNTGHPSRIPIFP